MVFVGAQNDSCANSNSGISSTVPKVDLRKTPVRKRPLTTNFSILIQKRENKKFLAQAQNSFKSGPFLKILKNHFKKSPP